MNPVTHFDKFRSEYNEFLNSLAFELDHPEDLHKVNRAFRAVLHTLRDRLTIPQSFHVMAQLPMFIKLDYIEGWKYHEKPIKYDTIEEFNLAVREEQGRLGERDFDWDESTGEIVNIILASLKKYLDEGTIQNIFAEIPPALHSLFI